MVTYKKNKAVFIQIFIFIISSKASSNNTIFLNDYFSQKDCQTAIYEFKINVYLSI